MDKISEIVGRRFGLLTVVEQWRVEGERHALRVKAICDCGQVRITKRKCVIDGQAWRCGVKCAYRLPKDRSYMIGSKYGRLTVVAVSDRRLGTLECACDCGRQVTVKATSLIIGRQSCGCIRGEALRGRISKQRGRRYVSKWKVQPDELVGKQFGRLKVMLASKIEPGIVVCRCDCGEIWQGRAYLVGTGRTKSCGCVAVEKAVARHTKHGMHKTAEYETWRGMIRRCYANNGAHWPRYGGRGITVCDRWRHGEDGKTGLQCFIDDMGLRPSPEHSIDRIDNDGNYELSNCRWATRRTQALNSGHSTRFGDRFREAVFGTPADAAQASHSSRSYR